MGYLRICLTKPTSKYRILGNYDKELLAVWSNDKGMLTDIFAQRYLDRTIWSAYTELEKRLLNQAFGIVKDALPYYDSNGKEIEANKIKWKSLHDRIARELGVNELSQQYYSYTQKNYLGQDVPVSGWFSWDHVCGQFVNATFSGQSDPDRFIKERLSFVELAMRFRGEEISQANAQLPKALAEAAKRDAAPHRGLRVPGSAVDGVKAWNATINSDFESQVAELNERFRRAKAPLTYHNGFIQVALDEIIEQNIAKPFWALVADPIWVNVDIDMKEALDRRDSNDKDPAIFAAKALESAIKEAKWGQVLKYKISFADLRHFLPREREIRKIPVWR